MRICGLSKSILDGSEIDAKTLINYKQELPKNYSFERWVDCIQDQGNKPYCVPYSLNTILEWYNKITHNKQLNLSLEYLFESRPDKSMQGMQPKQALSFIKSNGWLNKKTNELIKIKNFGLIKDIDTLKKSILINGPCLLALPVYHADSNTFWDGYEIPIGYHAVTCVGWNENNLIIKNSWGSNWGNCGYGYIGNDFFDKIIEAWTIIN